MSWASKDYPSAFLEDKRVTELWFEIIKEYDSEPNVGFSHWTTCAPTHTDTPHEPSRLLKICAHNMDDPPDPKGGRKPVTYKGPWDEQSIREFINGFIHQDSSPKKYQIWLSYCSYFDGYPEDGKVVDLLRKISKDLEAQDVEFKFMGHDCLVDPTKFGPNHFDAMVDPSKPYSSPSVNLSMYGYNLYDLHLHNGGRDKLRYRGSWDEQSIRSFINSLISGEVPPNQFIKSFE